MRFHAYGAFPAFQLRGSNWVVLQSWCRSSPCRTHPCVGGHPISSRSTHASFRFIPHGRHERGVMSCNSGGECWSLSRSSREHSPIFHGTRSNLFHRGLTARGTWILKGCRAWHCISVIIWTFRQCSFPPLGSSWEPCGWAPWRGLGDPWGPLEIYGVPLELQGSHMAPCQNTCQKRPLLELPSMRHPKRPTQRAPSNALSEHHSLPHALSISRMRRTLCADSRKTFSVIYQFHAHQAYAQGYALGLHVITFDSS